MNSSDTNYMISVNSVNEGIAIFRYMDNNNSTACLEYANTALCSLLHFTLEQLVNKEYAEIITSVHLDDTEQLWDMIRSLPQTKTGSCTFRFKDFQTGEMKWLKTSGQFKKDEKGNIACYAYSDITEQIEAVEREQRLAKCIQLITDETNFTVNMKAMMRCLLEQYQADRSYIFEFDWENDIMHNRIEETDINVAPEIDELQNMPIDIISYWLPHFKAGDAVFIENLETIREEESRKEEYDVLAMQDIYSLMVVPISKNGELYGYVGVDNPHAHFGDKKFLNNIAAILAQEYKNHLQQHKLKELSLLDPLTSINNRHAYNQRIDNLETIHSIGIGIVFTDVNGLKYVNDQYGHREGDNLIIRAVEVLKQYFREEDLYRISGDEFVVIVENIGEEEFQIRIKKMKMEVSTEYGAIFSIGQIWNQNANEIDKLVRQAEELMYDDKKIFYDRFPEKSRRGQ